MLMWFLKVGMDSFPSCEVSLWAVLLYIVPVNLLVSGLVACLLPGMPACLVL